MKRPSETGVKIILDSPVVFKIGHCIYDFIPLPIQPTDQPNNIWTIAKTSSFFTISCNGQIVLDYNIFKNGISSKCAAAWAGDKVDKIKFRNSDTASTHYQPSPIIGKKFRSSLVQWDTKCWISRKWVPGNRTTKGRHLL